MSGDDEEGRRGRAGFRARIVVSEIIEAEDVV